jgi:hypothetical protein
MGKFKPEDELNCGTCGMIPAVRRLLLSLRKAVICMCLPFLMEKSERFSNNIFDNTQMDFLLLMKI